MRKRGIIYGALAAISIVAVISVTFFVKASSSKYGTIEGKIADELSGDPVRGVRIVVDGRSTILYQTTSYKLTKIPPGEYLIQVSPPSGWVKFTKKIKINPGKNRLDIPLKGDKIPDLKEIICFSESKKEGIIIEVRFVDSKGIGMTEYPRLPIKIEVTLWERIGEEENYKKGKKLFEGPVKDFWDSQSYLEKNKGILAWDKIPGIKFEDRKMGIMEVRVHLKQGNFKDIIDDVKLFPEKEEK